MGGGSGGLHDGFLRVGCAVCAIPDHIDEKAGESALSVGFDIESHQPDRLRSGPSRAVVSTGERARFFRPCSDDCEQGARDREADD